MQLRSYIIVLLISFFASSPFISQVYNYTWMKGNPNTTTPSFGTMGISSASNRPGSQSSGITWYDGAGNLWLYGGQGTAIGGFGFLSDLWKYVPSTNNWTWISGPGSISQAAVYGTIGIASSSNTPGARASAASWVDSAGDLWLFGGLNAIGPYNDLWRFSITSGQWTWMGGTTTASANPVYAPLTVASSSAIPRASYNLVSWKDPLGNFWLYDGLHGNEIWRYNSTMGQWAHMSGVSTSSIVAGAVITVYGTQGVFSATVFPGERFTSGVSDAFGNLFVFGGKVYTATGFGRANDLWKYNITSNQWAWMGGTQSTSSSGSYGTQGIFSTTGIPAGRFGHTMWADNNNNRIWLFGGSFQTLTGAYWMNDTWCYDVASNQWAWMKGANTFYTLSSPGPSAVYGTQTFPGQNNTPGWRVNATNWPNSIGTMWIFSGSEWQGSTELWKFGACTNSISVSLSSSQTSLCPNTSATLMASGTGTAYVWNTGAQTNSIVVSPTVGTLYSVTGTFSNCATTANLTLPIRTISVVVQNTPPFCAGTNFSLSTIAGGTYSWSSGQNTASITVSPTSSSIYQVTANINNCVMTASQVVSLSPSLTLVTNFNSATLCAGQSTAITCTGANFYTWSTSQNGSAITVTPNANVSYSVVGSAVSGCTATAQVNITVNSPPALILSASSGSICSGNSATLTANGAASYSWSSGQASSSIQVSPLSTTVYTVIGTSNSCSTSSVIALQVQALPTVVIVGASAPICAGQSVQLVASGANSYQWSGGATSASLTVSPVSTSVYSVIGTSSACSISTTYTQVVNAAPVLTVTATSLSICAGETTTLTAAGANSYSWSSMPFNTPTIIITPATTVTYTLVAANLSACSNSSAITINVSACTGIAENTPGGNDWYVYPNPTSVSFVVIGGENSIMSIYTTTGQLVAENWLNAHEVIIDHALPVGLYSCRIKGLNKLIKIVVY